MLAGTMSLNQIVINQAGWFWDWYVFQQPLAFIVFFIAATAEGNRTPFDLTEADSEIVAGFATEYSGMRFGFFFFAEYVGVFMLSALTVVLFFGGWNAPIDPRPILDFLNVTINPAIDLAGMGIWLLWAVAFGVPLIILVLALIVWTFKSNWSFLMSLIVGFILFNVLAMAPVVDLGLPLVRGGRRHVLVHAEGVHIRVHLRLDARHAAACAHRSAHGLRLEVDG